MATYSARNQFSATISAKTTDNTAARLKIRPTVAPTYVISEISATSGANFTVGNTVLCTVNPCDVYLVKII